MKHPIAPEEFFRVGGSMHADAPSYVQRRADQELLEHTLRQDYCYVLTPRQMGKSSLIAHTAKAWQKKRIRSVIIDLQGKTDRDISAEAFYAGLLDALITDLRLPLQLEQWWQEHALLSAAQRFANFLAHEVLPRIEHTLVVCIDEIDQTLHLDFSDDFFAAIRACYNQRAHDPAFQKIAFVLVGVASPSDLVKDRTRSPFNIGHRIELTDFTFDEARKLAKGLPLQAEDAAQLLQGVLSWTGGHPYLTQKVCAVLAADTHLNRGKKRVDEVIGELFFADATWTETHLAHIRDRLVADKGDPHALLDLYGRIRAGERVLDEPRSSVHTSLKLAGIVKVADGGVLRPRNRIYERVFDLAWLDTVRGARLRRQVPAEWILATWKDKVSERLVAWRLRLEQAKPPSVYAALCAAALWPLVQAAQNEGILPVAMALGSVAAGMGGNLIAEQIQRWRDQAEAPSESNVEIWIASQQATNAELRQALDTILDHVQAIPQAQTELPEAERQWFTQTLHAELSTLGNLARFEADLMVLGSGAAATEDSVAAGAGGVAVGGDVHGSVVVTGGRATIVIGEQPITMTRVQRESALGRYLSHVISRNRYLQLQGIRSGGRLVNIELEHIYITLKATRIRTLEAEEAWLAAERQLAPGEGQKLQREPHTETVTVKVEEALAEHQRLVVLGDPGSGKTTLMRFLALCYARDCAEDSTIVRDRLGLAESGALPILLPLRNVGVYLKANYPTDDGTEGHGRLLEFLRAYLHGERIDVPHDFFDAQLETGGAVMLLDGMDEVGDFDLRRRVARLIEAFASAHPACRMIVTSRIVGYTGAARLGEAFATTTIRDFTLADVTQFLTHWHRLVAIGQMGPGEPAEQVAASQTEHLMDAIRSNPRVRELAINPLMLTVIALVHRDRVKLPERRAELYAEAVDVLLGKWDEARGVEDIRIFADRAFDATDRRLLLQSIALGMHEAGQKEIVADDLLAQLRAAFASMTADTHAVEQAVERFLLVIKERTGLLVEAGQGVYRFSHLTFQEYLAAVEMAEREDYVAATLAHTAEPFWREVILLEAGYLSTKNQAKTTRLIKAIGDAPQEPELFHNLVLAAECIRDVGPTRLVNDVAAALTARLQAELDKPVPGVSSGLASIVGRLTGAAARRQTIVKRRIAAATALGRIESGRFAGGSPYWSLPHGEPQWRPIPAGEFWMGSDENDKDAYRDEKLSHRLFLLAFQMAQAPITNAQYALYVQAAGAQAPRDWDEAQPPRDKLDHPVVGVSWDEACAYCEWLSQVTGKQIRLPSEAEWEKAARGDQDKRVYPWGDSFDAVKCNSRELGLADTTPVGVFPAGASPYGCLDMAGNVWEWTRSLWGKSVSNPDFTYPYEPTDGREKLDASGDVRRVLRGGSFLDLQTDVRCACRGRGRPGARRAGDGFRLVLLP